MLQLDVLFNVTNGLIIGAFYVLLMALTGLSLILNLSNVINFAHGSAFFLRWAATLLLF